jgi:hypothetical protein
VNEMHAQRVNYRAQCENKFNASDIPQYFPPHFTVFTLIAVALRVSSEKKTPKELVATPPHSRVLASLETDGRTGGEGCGGSDDSHMDDGDDDEINWHCGGRRWDSTWYIIVVA